ncbi:MAG: Tol-Pal system beta propeller repeat protein TolB [Gammaproteobacteria bacterium]|nr:MAG: Tol-Pal system beta propeller repeat protein TolB [Gammaproteobacteria bacterium]
MKILLKKIFYVVFLSLIVSNTYSVLHIEITQGVKGAIPIIIPSFSYSGASDSPLNVAKIIKLDLLRSGKFTPSKKSYKDATSSGSIDFDFLQQKEKDYLVKGNIKNISPGNYKLSFVLYDVFKKKKMMSYSVKSNQKKLRMTVHNLSDIIFKKITGIDGSFSAKIAYVSAQKTKSGKKIYSLQVAESDGHNPKSILTSKFPLMSPSWSHDGRSLVYVSFLGRKANIFKQTLATGARQKLASYRGINGAPELSPDGTKLVLTLSFKGNPDIYLLNLGTKKLKQITKSLSIDTEPVWMPDGKSIMFTSDRSGGPQIYEMFVSGGRAIRKTFEGGYNASPNISPDGKKMTFVTRSNRKFRVAVMDLSNDNIRILTPGPMDESPSFSPNGTMIIYAASKGYKGVLGAVSEDGRMRQRLSLSIGDVREPVWSHIK